MGASSVTRRNQLRREAQPRVSFALERSSLAFVIGGVSNRFVLGTICVATLFALKSCACLGPGRDLGAAFTGKQR